MSKADNLRILSSAGFQVPPFVVVKAGLFDEFRQVLKEPANTTNIMASPLPANLKGELIELAGKLPDGPLAVRSSMKLEDSSTHSFAGQLDSFLNVVGESELIQAVKACWASSFGERAKNYRKQHGLVEEDGGMEVIIQSMIPADVSGVVFTADPTARDRRWMVVSAVNGLGDVLVQGKAEGETWRIERAAGTVEGNGRILTKTQLLTLVTLSKKIEELFGSAQDIEFAWAHREFYILQARPITTPIPAASASQDEQILWDNSNITESYSGVTTPLTYSVIRDAYAQVYRQFLWIMGAHHPDGNILRNLLGFYNGQVYYQLANWYSALSYIPAFELNRRSMEQMMGVKQAAGRDTRSRAGNKVALILWIFHMAALHTTSDRRVKEFLNNFNSILGEYRDRDLNGLSPLQLRRAYLDLQVRVLGKWQAPILTDFFAMLFFGVLRRIDERWLDSQGFSINDLLAGDTTLESLEPLQRVAELAAMVRADGDLRSIFSGEASEILDRIRRDRRFSSFCGSFDGYLHRYGDRCMNELKLEEPNFRDDPARLIRIIAAAVENPPKTAQGIGTRADAEDRLARLPLFRRSTIKWILGYARRHVRNRENMRFARTRLFGLVRRILNALGTQWVSAGVLEHAADIYYLSIGEIWDFVEGTAVTQNLQGLAALRRAEYDRHQEISQPDRFQTFGVPYLAEPQDLLARVHHDKDAMKGTSCCSGKVRARARVVTNVDNTTNLAGDILVAERTDPGWVFIFPSASGILVERGSPLSHSAIVARELGIPTIVNIPGLTTLVHTGDLLEMDGGQGTLRVISQ